MAIVGEEVRSFLSWAGRNGLFLAVPDSRKQERLALVHNPATVSSAIEAGSSW
jgi:hypothetical protein